MAIINNDGMRISFECSDLISELKKDIAEVGTNETVCVWCRDAYGVTLYTNYDFIVEESPITKAELKGDEYFKTMTTGELLKVLEKQNEAV